MLLSPFLFFYFLLCLALLGGLLLLIEIEIFSRAFMILGLSPRGALVALLTSLLGSYINVPLYTVSSGPVPMRETVNDFGFTYSIPMEYAGTRTTIAINVGGAIVPIVISAYALIKTPESILPTIVGTAAVAAVAHHFAQPVAGMGIAVPIFIPPLVAALLAIFIARIMRRRWEAHVIAYVSGVMGILIGADLLNLGKVANLGAPVASIGGAGTFDGVFLTGIVAVLIAGLHHSRPHTDQYERSSG